MPIFGLGLHVLVAIYFAVHALRHGQNMYWLFVLFAFPLLGSIVYFIVIYLPALQQSRGGVAAKRALRQLVDPQRALREARQAFELTPTLDKRLRLAEALLQNRAASEALALYREVANGPFARDPALLAGLAEAEFETGATDAAYTTRGSKEAMLGVFGDFCPLVQKMLRMVPDGDVCEWKLRQHKTLSSWTDGAVALLGDACHPTLPHLSQGAAMAIEDGAVLAEVLSRVQRAGDPDSTYKCLKVYELLRKDRTTMLVNMAAYSGKQLHLGEGKAKEERDRLFREHKTAGKVPDKWASPDVQEMIYSHDCVKHAQENFDTLYAGLQSPANGHV